MPGHPDDRSREHRPRDRRGYHDDDSDEDYYRSRAPRSHGPRYEEPPTNGRRSRRQDKYDASSDDEDPGPPRRRSDRDQTRGKARGSPDLPPPPIGDDRRASKGRRGAHPDDPPPGAIPVPGTEAARKSRHEESDGRRRRGKDSGSPKDDIGEGPWDDAEIMPDPTKSSRDRHDHSGKRRPPRDVDDYDEPEPPRRSKGRDRDRDRDRERDRYDDPEPPRRSKRDPPEPSSRRRPSRPDVDEDRRHRRNHDTEEDSSDGYERPKRREKPSKYDDGYGTDRPRRQPKDDYYDRGYRTDGRDAKRDRHRDEDRRRSGRNRDEDDDYDRRRHDKRSSGRKGDGMDFNGMLEKGQKNWKKVEPVAKPLLAQLAKTYLHGGREG